MHHSRKRAIVTGNVQGVGFRYTARREAEKLGLVGFVRNRSDGSVETEFEGTDVALSTFIAWLNDGPPGATVSSVIVEDAVPAGGSSFEVRA